MTYAAGGLIQASDYNNLLNGSNQLNTVWSTGNAAVGYGQTALSTVAAGTDTVTATQWTTLINTLNKVRTHQTGSGSGISAVTAGATVNYLSTMQAQVNLCYSNAAAFSTQGATTTGSNDTWNPSAGATAAMATFKDCNVTFSSANAARYFFNAGGQINYYFSAVDNAGTTRSVSMRDMVNQMGGISAFRNTTNGGRTGSGGTLVTNNTAWGYRNNVFNSTTTIIQINDDAPYTGYNVQLQAFSGSNDYSNGANGNVFTLRLALSASADDAFGGAINVTITSRCDIVYPETTNLTNVWGTPTISYDYA